MLYQRLLTEYPLADATHDELLDRLADREFTDVQPALSANIIAYYGDAGPLAGAMPDQQKRSTRIRSQVALLKTTCSCP